MDRQHPSQSRRRSDIIRHPTRRRPGAINHHDAAATARHRRTGPGNHHDLDQHPAWRRLARGDPCDPCHFKRRCDTADAGRARRHRRDAERRDACRIGKPVDPGPKHGAGHGLAAGWLAGTGPNWRALPAGAGCRRRAGDARATDAGLCHGGVAGIHPCRHRPLPSAARCTPHDVPKRLRTGRIVRRARRDAEPDDRGRVAPGDREAVGRGRPHADHSIVSARPRPASNGRRVGGERGPAGRWHLDGRRKNPPGVHTGGAGQRLRRLQAGGRCRPAIHHRHADAEHGHQRVVTGQRESRYRRRGGFASGGDRSCAHV